MNTNVIPLPSNHHLYSCPTLKLPSLNILLVHEAQGVPLHEIRRPTRKASRHRDSGIGCC